MKAPVFYHRFGILLFAASIVAGWWLMGEISRWGFSGSPDFSLAANGSGPGPALRHGPGLGKGDEAKEGALPGIPAPSGLRGDFIHLSTIKDTRTLEAAATEATSRMALITLSRRWAELDPQGGIHWFLHGGAPSGVPAGQVRSMILGYWAQRDPAAALEYIGGLAWMDFSYDVEDLAARLVTDRLREDPAAALAVWRKAGARARLAMVEPVFEHLFSHDPEAALKEMAAVPADGHREVWAFMVYARDREALIRSLLAKPEVDCPAENFGAIFESLARQNPEAAKTIAESMPAGPRRAAACRAVLE
jgi:hypothetical protein